MEKKVMTDYSLFCTQEQTKKALELGAPIIELDNEVALEDRRHIGFGLPASGSFEHYLDKNEYPDIAIIDVDDVRYAYYQPTAEQMIGFLEKTLKEVSVRQSIIGSWFYELYVNPYELIEKNCGYMSRKEATLAAIDAALEYLSNNKK